MPAASTDALALARLRGEVASLRFHLALRRVGLALKLYNPDQPRVPAGNPDGGQWTDGGAGRGLGTGRGGRDNTSPKPTSPRAQVSAVDRREARVRLAGADDSPSPDATVPEYPHSPNRDARIEAMTLNLRSVLERVTSLMPAGSGPLYGIAVHTAFANEVRAENLPGVEVEQSRNSSGGRADYGELDSVRTDVALRDSLTGDVLAVWDVKTGSARMRASQLADIELHFQLGPEVPIYILRPGAPATRRKDMMFDKLARFA